MRCGNVQITSRTCSLLYFLIFFLNVSFYVVLYLGIPPTLSPPVSHQQTLCNCPTSSSDITCGTPPINQQATPTNLGKGNISSKHHLLAILVLSSLKGKERRDTIRETWMKGYGERTPDVLIKFALGIEGLSPSKKKELSFEEATHQDMLLLPNLQESYSNLTRKVLLSFIMLDSLFKFSYMMKCDDDSFVLLETILKELSERSSKRSFYWGFFDGRAHVKRRGKWVEKKWFLCDRYLPYALGGGYILSHDLVQRIVNNADGLVLYNSEDVSVGVWLSPYDAERKHDIRFNTEFVSRGCRNSYLVSHKQSIKDMLSKKKLLTERGMQCEREFQTRMSYIYNWTCEPTKCCERRKGIP